MEIVHDVIERLLDAMCQFSGSRRYNNDGNSQRSASTANPIIDVGSSNNNTNKTNSNENDQNESTKSSIADDEDAFRTLLKEAFQTIIQSDIRRGEFSGNSDGSSSQGRWLYDPAARKLQAVMDRLVIHVSFDVAADIGVADFCCNQETLVFQFY